MRNIYEEMEELKEKLQELTVYVKKAKMFPQEGEWYWSYKTDGTIYENRATNSKGRLNAYRTKFEAQKAHDIQLAKQRVAEAIAFENAGWVPDWKDSNQVKFSFFTVSGVVRFEDFIKVKSLPDYIHVKSEEVAKKILAEHEPDLLIILGE